MSWINKLTKAAQFSFERPLYDSVTKGWAAKFNAPDIFFAVFFVGIIILGSIYSLWGLTLIVAAIILKNRLQFINQQRANVPK